MKYQNFYPKETKLNKNSIYKRLIQILNDYGRGEVFDILKENNLQRKNFLVNVYRFIDPTSLKLNYIMTQ